MLQSPPSSSVNKLICKILYHHQFNATLLTLVLLLTCSSQFCQASFLDSTSLKPTVILILPQSFKVPLSAQSLENGPLVPGQQQFVAVINNVQNDRDNQQLRQQYPKLKLQVRDAKSPITGQLFYEYAFDYFPSNSKNHLLIPLNLDQVSSSSRDHSDSQQLVVSIRPHQLDTGFGSDGIEFASSPPIPIESVPSQDGLRSFAVVQTDKPIYKPEDKVRIRFFVLNENFRPVAREELRLLVKNPHKIIVEESRYPTQNETSSGSLVIDHTFEFPPEPMLGTWTVHLLHSDPVANDSTSFDVREYVLPTYEIQFESPKYILPSTHTIAGAIVAKYHYGKPVQGKAQFKFGYKESLNARPKFIARSSLKNVDPITGRVEYKIGADKFRENTWFPSIAGSRLVVEATVTEMTTGHREVSQDTSGTFISMPYKLSFENSIDDFRSGLSQQMTLQVLEMQTNQPAPPGLRLIAQYRNQNGSIITDHRQMGLSSQYNLGDESSTDSTGHAIFNIGPVREDITGLHIAVKVLASSPYRDDMSKQQLFEKTSSSDLAVGYHSLVKHESSNGWISIMNKTITQVSVGEEFISDLLIKDAAVVPQRIFYMVVSRGQIITMSNVDSEGLVKFSVTEAMLPLIRIVVFAITHDSVGLLSDSMKLNVGQDSNCPLTMYYKSNLASSDNSTYYKPNDEGKIAIQSKPGDIVSLIGIDSAVYTLNNRTRLESSRIYQRIKRLDTGCGFGGGKDNLDVFHNAGLMFFKDVTAGNPGESAADHLGSSCLTIHNQLRHIEDIQLGYSRPLFAVATQLNKPRSLELAVAVRQKLALSKRHKREIEVDSVLKRYKDPMQRSCCKIGTLEDTPQHRNCSVRARIVEKYMRQVDFRSCSQVYYDCCRAIFGEYLLLGSVVSARDGIEQPVLETRILSTQAAPQYTDPGLLANIGHLDRIEAQTLVRKDFRETWLFDLVNVDERSGSGSLDVRLPHSLTTWSITALALNRYQPICIMKQPLRITTFQAIFLQVSMPYKLIQGEQIDLVVTIFNYSPTVQEVLVYMYGVEDLCSEAEPGERSERKRVRLEKHSSQAVLFSMIPLKVGKYDIKILAITSTPGVSDIVERILNVVPRGKPVTDETTFSLDPMNHQRRSKRAIQTGNLVDEIDSSKGLQRSRVRLTPSRESEFIVPQTQECIISAIGDKMGQSVQTTMIDVENLIRLPHGCGEQVMIYLGPTLYTARYLSSINKLSGDLRWRAIRYIQSGYKRILNYRKEGGGFSAFARREPSIWLTAFIAKMLCQTERTPFIAEEIHVDRTVVDAALNWLVEVQNKETGTWVEFNPVYHREMLGGVLKENVLTAFVTISLNECAHHSPDLIDEVKVDAGEQDSANYHGGHAHTNGIDKLKVSTQRAEQALLLDHYKAVKEKNPYVLALTAYALSFSKPKDAASVLGDLLLFAERSQSRNQLYWRGDYQIETAAYALQALIELAPILGTNGATPSSSFRSGWLPGSDALAISNWLASRRSFTGAFESTQDTVVALESLSKLAQLQASPSGNTLLPQSSNSMSSLMCNVTISNRTRRSIEFGSNNAQILQTLKLESNDIDPFKGDMLDIVTSGNGLGTMSVKLKYHVFQEEDELCRFNIDSSIEEWQPKIQFDQSVREDLKNPSPESQSSNETFIEDDYFKIFDKSMLSELNLIDMNQLEPNEPRSQTLAPRRQTTASVSRGILRTRRSASNESWASRVVSNLKSKLPSWIVVKKSHSDEISTSSTISPKDTQSHIADGSVTRRTNTSRRSTQSTTMPMIVSHTGVPADAKLNALSSRLDLDLNRTVSSGSISRNDDSKLEVQQPVSSTVRRANRLVLLLRVCVHHMSSRRDSEMAVIEVGILSGFRPNEADLKEIINDVGTPAMRYEISADKSLVFIYMQYISSSGPYCLQFRLIRDSLVYNLQSSYIRVYEYYSPTHSCSNFYAPTRVADLIETKCDSSGQVCQCATRSICPANNKLLELGDINAVNATRARSQLIDLVCSNRYDMVSLVKLKSVRYLEAASMYKLSVKVKSDLKGNLTKILDAQRQQKSLMVDSVRKPLYSTAASLSDYINPPIISSDETSLITEDSNEEDSSLDYLNLSVDSNCVRNDALLLHLGHPNQWKQGGELMILFGRHSNLEKRYFKTTRSTKGQIRASPGAPVNLKPTASARGKAANSSESNQQTKDRTQMENSAALFEDAQNLQYSTTMLLDKNTILHDIAYQAKVEPRETINNLILWLELRARRERWACPSI